MECPFKEMDSYDFGMLESETFLLTEQFRALIAFIEQQYTNDDELYPALLGLETIVNKLKEHLGQQSKVYDLFQKDFNKNRALADGCSQTKALGEIEK